MVVQEDQRGQAGTWQEMMAYGQTETILIISTNYNLKCFARVCCKQHTPTVNT